MNNNKKIIIQTIFLITGVIFIVRLFFLQVIETSYKEEAERNATRKMIQYPFRGIIYDRNGKALVINQLVFDIMVVMNELNIPDTNAFCSAFNLTKDELHQLIRKIKEEKGYNKYRPVPLLKQLSVDDIGKALHIINTCEGIYPQERTIRIYPHKSLANALGYIGEISKKQLENQEENYYEQGDLIGISGIEASYEKYLRGTKGVRYIMKDVHGVEKGPYLGGKMDVASAPGQNLICTIDLELQKYGEWLMQNKVGSVVAIEPSTGEILALISSPSYDPNLLTGRYFSKNFDTLQKDPLKPLFNRATMAMYSPGSIFKVAQALVGLHLGVLTPNSIKPCNPEAVGVKCHPHPSPTDLKGSIQWSCNPYYYDVFRSIIYKGGTSQNKYKQTETNYDIWRSLMVKFGFGQKLEVDLPNIKAGFLPTNAFYDRIYGNLSWKHSTIRSLDIGQGELLVVPIQIANLACIVANRGFYITPHLVKAIGNDEKKMILTRFTEKKYTGIDTAHFNRVIEGMELVVRHGTAYWTQIPGINICGKTGTVQNTQSIKEKGDDHSTYMAFAPKDNPKIAIAVYVENGGFGAVTAAPIANLMIEKYLTDTTTALTRYMRTQILQKDLIHKAKGEYR